MDLFSIRLVRYGWASCESLPCSDLRWCNDEELARLRRVFMTREEPFIADDADVGYILEVTCVYVCVCNEEKESEEME